MSDTALVVDREKHLPRTFEVEPYRTDGGISLGGAFQLIGLLGLTGIILGAIASYISQYFYLILLFPFGIGIVVAFVGNFCIRKFHIRRPLTCGVAGFVAGCLAMISMHYFDYQRFDSTLQQGIGEGLPVLREMALNFEALKENLASAPDDERETIQIFVDEVNANPLFLEALLVDSLPGYIEFQAKQGVTIGRGGRGGVNLGSIGSYVYWGMEAIIVAGLAFVVMKGTANEPYCTGCNEWKVAEAWGPLSAGEAVTEAIKAGRVEKFSFDPNLAGKQVLVTAFRCQECEDESNVDVRVEAISLNNKGEVTRNQLTQVTYPGLAYHFLFAACAMTPGVSDEIVNAADIEEPADKPATT